MSDVRTRRVIEVQSDLYQKGGIEKAKQSAKQLSDKEFEKTMIEAKKAGKSIDEYLDEKIKPLTQYNDPTAHFRMVREEIKQAAGKHPKINNHKRGCLHLRSMSIQSCQKYAITATRVPI